MAKNKVEIVGIETGKIKTISSEKTIGLLKKYHDTNDKYYFDELGRMAFGFKKIEDETYYFDNNGIMLTGIKFPATIDKTLSGISSVATPLGLIILGASINLPSVKRFT